MIRICRIEEDCQDELILAFFVSIEPFHVIADRFRVGVKAEFYVEPDFPSMEYNLGPQIRIRL